ncbi:hypothetical protein V8C44DRAFT_195785 [Trichoderma aethiopicum]
MHALDQREVQQGMQARTSRGGIEKTQTDRQTETRMEARAWRWLTRRGACEPGRVQGPRVAVCRANGGGLPARQTAQYRLAGKYGGVCGAVKAQARRERAEFSLQTECPESNPRPVGEQRPKERCLLGLGRQTTPPAQWATAADRGRGSTAACSTVSVADPGSRRSMDTLLYAVGLSASVQLQNPRLCPIAAAAARCRSLEPLGLGLQRPATASSS